MAGNRNRKIYPETNLNVTQRLRPLPTSSEKQLEPKMAIELSFKGLMGEIFQIKGTANKVDGLSTQIAHMKVSVNEIIGKVREAEITALMC